MANNLQQAKNTFSNFLTQPSMKAKIDDIIGGKDGAKFISSLVASVSANKDLQQCEHGSLFSAALLGVSLNLSPSPQLGHFYMVPFNDKKAGCKKASFMLGYKGMIQLALRTGKYKKINAIAIKEGELKRYNPLEEIIEVEIIEDDAKRESAETIGFYGFFETTNGFRKAIYWSKEKILNHADKHSASFSKHDYLKFIANQIPQKDLWKFSSAWYTDFDKMGCKTVLRDLFSTWGILSIDEQKAFESDERVINDDLGVEIEEVVEKEDSGFDYSSSEPIQDIDNDGNVIEVEKVDLETELRILAGAKSKEEIKKIYEETSGKFAGRQADVYQSTYNQIYDQL